MGGGIWGVGFEGFGENFWEETSCCWAGGVRGSQGRSEENRAVPGLGRGWFRWEKVDLGGGEHRVPVGSAGGSTGGACGAGVPRDHLTTPPRCGQEKEKAQKGQKTETAPTVREDTRGYSVGTTPLQPPPMTLREWGEPAGEGDRAFGVPLFPRRAKQSPLSGGGGATFLGPPLPLPGLFLTPWYLGP